MRRYIPKLSAVLFFGLIVSQVFADDVAPPATRGQAGSTYSLWDFGTSSTNPPADSFINPNGTPNLTITQSADSTGIGWQNSLPAVYGAKQGFWDLGDDGHINISIPTPGPGTTTETLQLQVTYWLSIDQAPGITFSPSGTVLSSSSVVVLNGPHNLGSWNTEVIDLSLSPNPMNNMITISGDPSSGSVIDQVIIDTLTVPEPSSLSLIGVTIACGAGLRWWRRRNGRCVSLKKELFSRVALSAP